MNRSTGLLTAYATLIRRVSGAESVCIFVPADEERTAVYLLEGALPVAELADAEAAATFTSSVAEVSFFDRTDSDSPNGWLTIVPCSPTPLEVGRPEARRRRFEDDDDSEPPAECWIGLRFSDDARGHDQSSKAASRLLATERSDAGRGDAPPWESLLSLGGILGWYAGQISSILDDPVTGLAGRAEFQSSLSLAMERATERSRPLSLLFVNPDDFTEVNEQVGHEAGDRVLREIGARLRATHRTSDSLAKYGGAIFASFLQDTDLAAARVVAEKVWAGLSEWPYLDGSVRLGISIGVAVFEPTDDDVDGHLELIRRADKALNAAKRVGGDHIVAWEPELDSTDLGNVDRMTGVYTGNMAKDYRNMTLLSDTMTVIAGSSNTVELAVRVVERLYATLRADHVGLYRRGAGELTLLKGLTKRATGRGSHEPSEGLTLDVAREALLSEASERKDVRYVTFKDEFSEENVLAYAVPMVLNGECNGCLFLDGREGTLGLTGSSDLGFLRAFAAQLAVALDRARLEEQQQHQSEKEQTRLREEVDGLRASLHQTKLVYRSREMESVLETVRRVAPTNATVLVIGESGTGKELVARTIHDESPYRAKPVIVVDCGAIPMTLIESELFGHERGAYTGAQERRAGRLLEAEGGTLILDEIGELPLEVQSKLLRFVQERQITPVGGTLTRRVDTRLVAVTNRELAVEAAAGRFREDLYYRLNVVRINVPPLRERPEDVLLLAEFFLESFALQYQRGVMRFDDAARALMLDHSWPGNVRELQNRIMQAVILCEGDEIGVSELELETIPSNQTIEMDLSMIGPGAAKVARSLAPPDGAPPKRPKARFRAPDEDPMTAEQAWSALRSELGRQIDSVLEDTRGHAVPLGTWLMEDLVLEAYDASGGVSGRARALLGVPETTFRRRLRKASSKAKAELLTRKPHWSSMMPLIRSLVRAPNVPEIDVLQVARQLLLDEVVKRIDDPSKAAALMGVTVRTYRRWMAEPNEAAPLEPAVDEDADPVPSTV